LQLAVKTGFKASLHAESLYCLVCTSMSALYQLNVVNADSGPSQ